MKVDKTKTLLFQYICDQFEHYNSLELKQINLTEDTKVDSCEIFKTENNVGKISYKTSWWTQFSVLFARNFIALKRTPTEIRTELFVALVKFKYQY